MPTLRSQFAAGIALAAVLLACGRGGDEGSERLNLILVSLDTCRADRLSPYGYDIETPNLADLAAEAVVFTDCLAQSTATAPSHLSMFTGQFVHRHKLHFNGETRIPPWSLASVLGDAGWRTGAFAGHGSLQGRFGHGVGFEVFQSWDGPEPDPAAVKRHEATRELPDVIPHALRWLDDTAAEPFFLFVHGYDTHCPYWPPEPHRSRLAGWYEGDLDLREPCGVGFQDLYAEGRIDAEGLRYLSDMYDAEVVAADEALGTLFDALRERGLLERSILVFTSDHGEVLGEHDWIGHTRTFEPELRVPLIVRFPGGQWARELDAPAQHVDLLPTLLSALGVPAPEGHQGADLMPAVRGEVRAPWEQRLRVSTVRSFTTLRYDPRWKLVFGREAADDAPQLYLYDLEHDPGEEHNLCQTEDGLARFRRVYEEYEAWRESTKLEDLAIGARYDGVRQVSAEDLEMLRALGYAGDDD